ncbi:MAG: response regulator [Halobacteriovoraceae bacterium]|nr:response regulator [Halobacteriovoraceae bacterium]
MGRSKILVVDDEEGIRDVISMIIESYFENEIITAASGNEAIAILKEQNSEIGMMFCDFRMNDGTGADAYNFLKGTDYNIPFILCSTYNPGEIGLDTLLEDNPLNSVISKPFTSDDIIDNINSSLYGDSKKEGGDGEAKEELYLKIEADRFLNLNKDNNINVYIRISDEKFIKIVDDKTHLDPTIIKKYQSKGASYVYLEKDKYLIFLDQSLLSIFSKLDDESISESDMTGAVLSSIDSIQNCVRELGVNQKTVELIGKTVEATEKLIKKTKSLDNLLEILNNERAGYIKDHAYLTAYIACSIAEKVSWKTEQIWNKIIMASFFHNIALEENDHAKIFDLTSAEYLDIGHANQVIVRDHVFKSVELLGEDSSFEEDTRKMILSHHEQPDGSGFPRRLTASQITPLEALFVLAVNFAHVLYSHEGKDEEVAVIVQDFNEKFNKGNFKKPYQGFLQAFVNIHSTD